MWNHGNCKLSRTDFSRTETSDAGLLCMYSNQWMSDGAVLFGAFEKMVHRIKGGKINGNSGSNLTCNCIFPDAGI